MTDTELKAHGWQKVNEHWVYPGDAGFMHDRVHTRRQAVQRTTKAVMKSRRILDVWVLPPRSIDYGIFLGFIHPRREGQGINHV